MYRNGLDWSGSIIYSNYNEGAATLPVVGKFYHHRNYLFCSSLLNRYDIIIRLSPPTSASPQGDGATLHYRKLISTDIIQYRAMLSKCAMELFCKSVLCNQLSHNWHFSVFC